MRDMIYNMGSLYDDDIIVSMMRMFHDMPWDGRYDVTYDECMNEMSVRIVGNTADERNDHDHVHTMNIS